MCSIDDAIKFLKSKGIESHENMGVLIIPVADARTLDSTASKIKKLLVECGYEKSWSLNPYYYDEQRSIVAEMYK